MAPDDGFFSPNLEAAIVMQEALKTFQKAGFSEQQALFIVCWMSFGPRFEVPPTEVMP